MLPKANTHTHKVTHTNSRQEEGAIHTQTHTYTHCNTHTHTRQEKVAIQTQTHTYTHCNAHTNTPREGCNTHTHAYTHCNTHTHDKRRVHMHHKINNNDYNVEDIRYNNDNDNNDK